MSSKQEALRVYEMAKQFVDRGELTIEAVGILIMTVEHHAIMNRDNEVQAILLKHLDAAKNHEVLLAIKAVAEDFCKPSPRFKED